MDSHWPDWVQHSACLQIGTDGFYPSGMSDDWETPRRVCMEHCNVRLQCLDRVMGLEQGQDYKTRWGIIAGLSPLERKALEPHWLSEQGDVA